MSRKKLKLLTLAVVILVIATVIYIVFSKEVAAPDNNRKDQSSNQETPPGDTPGTSPAFNKTRFSVDDPASVWVIVNKKRPLPASYLPTGLKGVGGANLSSEAAGAAETLIAAAAKEGVNLKVISGFRSFATQQSLYNNYVQQDGQAAADTYSARPGHSEHQTGLAADLGNSIGSCDLDECFANTGGGKWLAGHAHEYGFTISYPKGKTAITGYQYEPWHIRYVGNELAAELQKTGLTMQEFFGLPATPGY